MIIHFYEKLLYCLYKNDLKLLETKIKFMMNLQKTEKEYDEKLSLLLILAEDRRFKYHIGFDMIGILRAFYRNTFKMKREGASTIEQQLVRTILKNYKISYSRKLKEILLAVAIHKYVDKKNIPYVYLSMAYFGHNIYGYKNIAAYLNIDIDRLKVRDAAQIIARLKYPNSNHVATITKIENRADFLVAKYNQKKVDMLSDETNLVDNISILKNNNMFT